MIPTDSTWEGTPYPDLIRNLPEIDIALPGIRGWLLQADRIQVVFFDIQPTGKVPPHAHCAQWGVMLDGEMELTIGDQTRLYRRGDRYYIPRGVVHSAVFLSRVNAIDVFDDPHRYKPK